MRRSQAFSIIGGLLLIGGIFFLRGAGAPGDENNSFSIPSGEGWFYEYELSFVGEGRITGSYTVQSGGAVELFVFTKNQRDAFVEGGLPGNEFHTTGTAGAFDVRVPGGTHYLVFTHTSSNYGTGKNVDLNWQISGYDTMATIIGVVLLLAGIGTYVAWYKARKREEAERPAGAVPAQDIVHFSAPPSADPSRPGVSAVAPRVVTPPPLAGPGGAGAGPPPPAKGPRPPPG
ncbi:MAG TPA: hypothetical protein VGB42_00615 [Candidatus Thermoplasmatota archaeon]